jgi:hypothetical protein
MLSVMWCNNVKLGKEKREGGREKEKGREISNKDLILFL